MQIFAKVKPYEFHLTFILFAIETILVIYFSVMPITPLPGLEIPYMDYFMHFISYLVYAALLVNIFKHKTSTYRIIFLSILISFCFGLLNEILQLFVPMRSFEIIDLTINGFGAVIGASFFYKIKIFFNRNQVEAAIYSQRL